MSWQSSLHPRRVAIALGFSFALAAAPMAEEIPTHVDAREKRPAAASTRRSPVIEEIIITAQKRSENIRDVPLSISALSGEFLADAGIADLNDLALYTPNLKVTSSPGLSFINIRGLGSGNNKGFEQSVGLIIDGVYYGRASYLSDGLLDLERVEVLRGPQGTLFGKNTIAGAMNITTTAPSDEFTGFADVAFGELGMQRQRVGIGGPLIEDTLNYRIAASRDQQDGHIRNRTAQLDPQEFPQAITARPFFGDRDNDNARIKLTMPALSKNLNLTLQYEESEVYSNHVGNQLSRATAETLEFYSFYDPNVEANSRDHNTSLDAPEFAHRVTKTVVVTANLNLSDYLFTAIAGHSRFAETSLQDLDFGPAPMLFRAVDDRYEQNSLELRVTSPTGPVEYVAGLYYFDNTLDGFSKLSIDQVIVANMLAHQRMAGMIPASPLPGAPAGAVAPQGAPAQQDGSNKRFLQASEAQALFGQATWHATSRLSLIGGMRYSLETKSLDTELFFDQSGTLFQAFLGQQAFIAQRQQKEEDFSPKLSLMYELNDAVNLYGTFARAFKAGGYNEAAGNPEELEFEPEQATTYEAGAKLRLLDGGATLNISLYETEFDNLQVSTFDGTSYVVGNAAEAITRGVEIDAMYMPWYSLAIGASMGFNDAYYKAYPDAQCPSGDSANSCDLKGRELVRAPRWTGSLSANLTLPLWPSKNLVLLAGADALYQHNTFLTTDLDPLDMQPAYVLYNLRMGVANSERSWQLTAFLQNLSDEIVKQGGADVPLQPGSHFAAMDAGRRIFAEFRLSW
jgi:iron complex outermembrane receptor protein